MTDRAWLALLALGVVALALYSVFGGGYGLTVLRDALIFALLAASLDFFWGGAGILSFGHAVFFGVGGYAMALLTLHVSWPAAGLIGLAGAALSAALLAAVVGYFLFFGGVRGSYFTIVTLALSVIVQQAAISWSSVTGGDSGLLGIPPLVLAAGPLSLNVSGDLASFWFVVVVLVATLLVLRALSRGRWERILAAISDNEVRAAALGHNAALRLTLAFVLSAAVAGLAGAIYVAMAGLMAPDLSGLLLSTEAVIWVAIGGRGTLIGPVVGAVVAQRAQQVISSYNPSLWPLIIGGLFILMVFAFPDGVTPVVQRGWRRLEERAVSAPLLEARNVSVRFGGLQALANVDFRLGERELVCIIGPNGAGKSTFLNVLTGMVRPTDGAVRFRGREIAALPLHRIARLGIARKFQIPSVFPSLSVRDNLRVAQWGAVAAPRPQAQVLDMIGLGGRIDETAATLSHGERQWLEIGMAIAAGPSLLLLDEPTAGMTPRETLATAELLLRLTSELAIVAVEHDIRFVRALDADTLVLHQGRAFRRGPFSTVEADEAVRDVYLGRR